MGGGTIYMNIYIYLFLSIYIYMCVRPYIDIYIYTHATRSKDLPFWIAIGTFALKQETLT